MLNVFYPNWWATHTHWKIKESYCNTLLKLHSEVSCHCKCSFVIRKCM